jgi:hypothetical protein
MDGLAKWDATGALPIAAMITNKLVEDGILTRHYCSAAPCEPV